MFGLEDVTAWAAVGTSALAALLVLLGVLLAIRWRRASERRLRTVQESAARSEEMLAELTGNLERVENESEATREQGERTEREARRLRVLSELGSTLELDDVAHRALEHTAAEVGADGAMAVLQGGSEEPFTASFGLSAAESERELVGLPPNVNEARAVTIRYRYSPEEVENDAFRLTSGLAVPLEADDGRIGTLAVFWRRTEREPGDEEIARLEDVSRLLAPPLDNARRFEEVRRLADLDPVTGLQNERYFADRLVREVSRARRYERRLALLLFRFPVSTEGPGGLSLLASVGRRVRSAVRSADISCHIGEGRFAVILPEAGLAEAEHLYRRLQFAVGSRIGGGTTERVELPLATAELSTDDNADSLLHRAHADLAAAEEPNATAAPAETRA